jgi:DNA (cytosine-5)-methyltransferase 1
MGMTAYYNEFDPYAAQFLRNLIAAGHIANGIVDSRSITDVTAADLAGFTQCHFFAGIGGWSLALRLAGWPDDRAVWTGSCPCQPFSSAGASTGFADDRHLWPTWERLIAECRPAKVYGEQVASKAAEPWIDLVQTDMEALGYAFGCIAFPSAGVGAPHIRDRAYWVGHADKPGSQGYTGNGGAEGWQGPERPATEAGVSLRVADTTNQRPVGRWASKASNGANTPREQPERFCNAVGLANPDSNGREQGGEGRQAVGYGPAAESDSSIDSLASGGGSGPTNGFWRDVDWLYCRDGKWRPVKPGSFPLVDGAAARVGRLRGYGNAINAKAAEEFIKVIL